MYLALSLFIYIGNVYCKFERDITYVQLQAICKIMFNKGIYFDKKIFHYNKMHLYAYNSDDIKLMKVI